MGVVTDTALNAAVKWIADYEGFRSKPYRDQGGVWTIGYGATYLPNGARVTAGTSPVTQETAYSWLTSGVSRTLAIVRDMVEFRLSDNQAVALTSLGFNIGTGALRNSTLLKLLNAGEVVAAAGQFDAWVYDDNRVDQGLVKRRNAERKLFLTPDVETTT